MSKRKLDELEGVVVVGEVAFEGEDGGSEEEEDEDEGVAPNQVLPVANLPEDYNGTPQDGAQYLFTVRRDAKRLPKFKKVVNPYFKPFNDGLQANSEYDVSSVVPTEEWKGLFLEHFNNCRQNVARYSKADEACPKEKLPSFHRHDEWWQYITGVPKVVKPAVSIEGSQHGTSDQNASTRGEPHEPTWPRVGHFSQSIIMVLLGMFTKWIQEQEDGFTFEGTAISSHKARLEPIHQRWLFWLLIRLDNQLLGDDISDLRVLARACIAYIKSSAEAGMTGTAEGCDSESLVGYWMVVAAVAGVWGQKDIWDEARACFRVQA